MRKEKSGNPEMAFLRCALIGAGLIVVLGAVGPWAMFVVSERLHRHQIAKRLQGGWITDDGMEFWFNFTRGDRGTLETWTADGGQSQTRARVVWTRGEEAALAVGPRPGSESFVGLYLGGDRDTITWTDDSTEGPPLLLRRNKRPAAR